MSLLIILILVIALYPVGCYAAKLSLFLNSLPHFTFVAFINLRKNKTISSFKERLWALFFPLLAHIAAVLLYFFTDRFR